MALSVFADSPLQATHIRAYSEDSPARAAALLKAQPVLGKIRCQTIVHRLDAKENQNLILAKWPQGALSLKISYIMLIFWAFSG
jgi:hypothetical protein